MALLRMAVEIPHVSGIPRDTVVNTFHFVEDMSTPAAGAEECTDRLMSSFYAYNVPATGARITQYISDRYDLTNVRVRAWNMADPLPRVPVYEDTRDIGISRTGTGNLPSEVSLVCSFRGVYSSGVANARRRGRVYIGPLRTDANINTNAFDGRPSNQFINTVHGAGANLMAQNDADAVWVVYSRAAGSSSTVVAGWVDNAWDTQRRRGVQSTGRSTWGP